MKHVRAIVRLLLLAVLTGVVYLTFLVSRCTLLVSQRWALRSQAWCFRSWCRGVARIGGMAVETRGQVPRPPCFLVSNHVSYMDVIALGTTADWTFIAKSEVARWPLIGLLARSVNVIFIDRARRNDLPRVIALMESVLDRQHGVTFFPEGTSSCGDSVLPFRASLFEAPIRTGYPVACASLSYSTPASEPPAGAAVSWWGDMGFVSHFYALLGLRSFQATVTYGNQHEPGGDRKKLAESCFESVTANFVPLTARR